MANLHRRDWLKQSSFALAGLGLMSPLAGLARTGNKTGFSETLIRLNANENPYGPSPLARKAMAEAVTASNRYPWDATTQLREAIGKIHGFDKDHVLIGAGSSEMLGLAAQLAALQKGTAVTADPSFSIWATAAERLGLQTVRVPLTQDKKHNLAEMLSRLTPDTRLFYICNPNNPTGTLLPAADIRNAAMEASKRGYVVVDEAYLDYTNEPSQASLVANNANVIVVKTFSKIHGLAGARVGYAIAHPDTVKKLSALQPWSNAGASAVSVAGAAASLGDRDFLETSKKQNSDTRAFTEKELKAFGFSVIPSQTNFIYYSLGNFSGSWTERMRDKNILVGRIAEPAGQWTRITIGTNEEMRHFVSAAKAIL